MIFAIDLDCQLLTDLVSNKKYREALEYIDSLTRAQKRDLSRHDLAALYLAHAQCLYRTGEFSKAAVKLKTSIKLSRSLHDDLLYGRQKYTLGQIYLETGRLDLALAEFNESHAFFRRFGDTERTFLALEMIALMHSQKGNYAYACERNELILTQARRLQLSEHVRLSAFNLCRVLMLTGELTRVRELLDSVADDCTDSLSLTWLESLRGMLSARLLDDISAEEHLGNAIARARECHYRRDEVVCLEYVALNDFYHGRYVKAIDRCEQILATQEVTPSAVAQTLWLLTEVYVAENKLTLAAETGAKGELAITQVKEWAELGGLHRALALLADKRGEAHLAGDHFDKSIEILARHGARYELAVTYLAIGQARCLPVDLKRERLQQAKTLFTEMNVPKRVAQVDNAMVALCDVNTAKGRPAASYGMIAAPTIIGQSEQIRDLLSRARKFGEAGSNILITGETGTGKDLLAQYVHALSPRGSRPFVVVNSATIPENLLEAELFGVCKGSYSGAEKDRMGLIAQADGGSFFFDEISETPLFLQAKLLRVLETKVVRRVGENRDHCYDVRFIAATNCDLGERVRTGLFREDLYYRLRRGQLQVPTLRERKADLPLLIHHFLSKRHFADYTLEQVALLVDATGCDRYDWPGNARQLEGVINDAATMCSSKRVMDLVPILRDTLIRLSKNDPENSERGALIATLERNSATSPRQRES